MYDWLWITGVYLVPAYFVGSIPYGYILGRLKGIDIRQHGSGNIGATNVWRVLGKSWGIMTLSLDFMKAPLAMTLVFRLDGLLEMDWPPYGWQAALVPLIPFLGAVLGHNYPFWLRFKGGKGIATSAGGLLWLIPIPFLMVLVVWLLVFGVSRYVSLASIVAAVVLPIATFMFYPDESLLLGLLCFLATMAVWRHRTNIERLVHGTEHKWTKKKDVTTVEQRGES